MRWTIAKPKGSVPIAIRFDLPYCLHLRDGAYVVKFDDVPIEVETRKLWRNSEDSSTDDTVAEDRFVFPDGEIVGGLMGGDPSDAQRIVGTNMEFAGDPTGYFRHTQMVVGLTCDADEKPDGSEIAERAVEVANVLIDVYRFATGRAYLPRLRVQDIRYLEIAYPLSGEVNYVMLFGNAVRIALINETSSVHETVREMAGGGEPVPIHADLLLAAIRAVWETDFRLAVVESVTALEAYVSAVLERELVESGNMTVEEFDDLMRNDGRVLSDMMKKPLRKAIGKSPADNTQLWNRWISANRIRRDVTHNGHFPSEIEASLVLRTVQELLEEMGDSGMHLAEEMTT